MENKENVLIYEKEQEPIIKRVLAKKKNAKRELMESEFSFENWVPISELATQEWIDNAFDYLFKRYKKGKRRWSYSWASWNTLVSGTLSSDKDWSNPEIKITVSKGYIEYDVSL